MITRDDLADAVAQIGRTDPELGHGLAPLLADGRLAPADAARPGEGEEAAFVLDGERVTVRRHQFIHQGVPALVEKLVVAAARQEARRLQSRAEFGWQRDRLRREAQRTALERLLDFRLDEETRHYQSILAREPLDRHASAGLTLLEDLHGDFPGDVMPWNPAHGSVFFKGVVEVDTSALFVQLPMTRDALLQIADRDLEFFNLHHVFEVLRRGEHRRLFACVVHGRLAGMMEVGIAGGSGFEDLEIRYLATAQGGPQGTPARGEWAHRGAGAMLLAGAWLLWKIYEPMLANLVVRSEPGAVDFYASLGFVHAQPHVFHLEDPRGHFLRNIVAMANRVEALPQAGEARGQLPGTPAGARAHRGGGESTPPHSPARRSAARRGSCSSRSASVPSGRCPGRARPSAPWSSVGRVCPGARNCCAAPTSTAWSRRPARPTRRRRCCW